MTGLVALEVAIGLSFLYLVFSLVVSRINEAVASLLKWRAEGLEQALRGLVTQPEDTENSDGVPGQLAQLAALTHPLLKHLWTPRVGASVLRRLRRPAKPGPGGQHAADAHPNDRPPFYRPPSYLSPRTFSLALLDILTPARPDPAEQLQRTNQLRNCVADLAAAKPAAAERLRDRLPAQHAVLTIQERERLVWVVLDDPDLDDHEKTAFTGLLHQLSLASTAPAAQLAEAVEKLPEAHPLRAPLLHAIGIAAGDLDKVRTTIEQAFDEAMDRISGWYKRKVQIAITIYAIVLVLALNADSITLARTLWTDGPVRQAVVAATDKPNQDPATAEEQLRKLVGLALPIGWATGPGSDPRRHLPGDHPGWLVKLLGLAITVGALSAGAPFWYDTLGKLARLRSSGPPPAPTTPDRPALVVQAPSEAG
jgi:hypothetical protein